MCWRNGTQHALPLAPASHRIIRSWLYATIGGIACEPVSLLKSRHHPETTHTHTHTHINVVRNSIVKPAGVLLMRASNQDCPPSARTHRNADAAAVAACTRVRALMRLENIVNHFPWVAAMDGIVLCCAPGNRSAKMRPALNGTAANNQHHTPSPQKRSHFYGRRRRARTCRLLS